jgi:copper chaperone NosL
MRLILVCLITLCLASMSLSTGPETVASAQKTKCPACGMFVSMFLDWNSRVEFKDSTTAVFDGSKCMFKYYLNLKKYNPSKAGNDVASVWVKDYFSKVDIDGRQAFYVIWGDVYGPMGHEPIPFEKEGDAKKFLREHKGKKILRFNDINLDLIASLDNP